MPRSLSDLLALAERATPGPWVPHVNSPDDARFIAAFDPTTVRLLIAVAQAAERVNVDRASADGLRKEPADCFSGELVAIHDALDALHAHLKG